jgi:hypothetical protein
MQSFNAPDQTNEFIPCLATHVVASDPYVADNPVQRITICHGIISCNCLELIRILNVISEVENQRQAVLEEGKQYYQDILKMDPNSRDKNLEDWWLLQSIPIALPGLISPQISMNAVGIYNESILVAVTQTQVTEYHSLCTCLDTLKTNLNSLQEELGKLRTLLIKTLHTYLRNASKNSAAPKASRPPQPQREVSLSRQSFFVGAVISEDAELIDYTGSRVTGKRPSKLRVDTDLANRTHKRHAGRG